ncbi:unnamed protein product [Heligmosomoides polygyrus]|uniref:Cytochrome P450 n=1 Tax=Heligmosomoides polygyrus TaxID=6339 RepID=A0A183G805_HELPZ|nr:unnamed protein product [Heligmosomoides polygyrus]
MMSGLKTLITQPKIGSLNCMGHNSWESTAAASVIILVVLYCTEYAIGLRPSPVENKVDLLVHDFSLAVQDIDDCIDLGVE